MRSVIFIVSVIFAAASCGRMSTQEVGEGLPIEQAEEGRMYRERLVVCADPQTLLAYTTVGKNKIRLDSIVATESIHDTLYLPLKLYGDCWEVALHDWMLGEWLTHHDDAEHTAFNLTPKKRVGGYDVTLKWYRPQQSPPFGSALLHFKSDTEDFYINNEFCWPIKEDFENADQPMRNGEYLIDMDQEYMLSGKDSTISQTVWSPFLLKDIDFDGRNEILFAIFTSECYNIIYKPTTGKFAKELEFLLPNADLRFDYKRKRIHGLDSNSFKCYKYEYWRNPHPANACDLMTGAMFEKIERQSLSGRDTTYFDEYSIYDNLQQDKYSNMRVVLQGDSIDHTDELNYDLVLQPYYNRYGKVFRLDSLQLRRDYHNESYPYTVRQIR